MDLDRTATIADVIDLAVYGACWLIVGFVVLVLIWALGAELGWWGRGDGPGVE